MITPNTPTPPNPGSRWRRLRPSRRGATIGAVVVALLIVAGVAAALLTRGDGPGWDDHHGPRDGGPGVGLADGFGELGGRGGPLGRGLGDDTLLVGTVVATADGSVVVAPDSGEQRTIRTDDSTRVRGGGNTGLADLEAGERVVIRVAGAGDAATAVSILTPQARVIGTVTALSGDLATITSIDGRTVTANLSALTEQPAVGDLIALTGTATNPTTITATTLTPVRG